MGDWKRRLSEGSRDRRKLVVAAGIIAAVSMLLGLLIDVTWGQAPPGEGSGGRAPLGGVLPDQRIPRKDFERVQEALLRPPELSVEIVIWFLQEAADHFGPGGAGRPEKPEAEERGDLLGRAGPVVVGELLEKTEMDEASRRAFDRYARAVFLDGEAASEARGDLVAVAEAEGAPQFANLLLADVLQREEDVEGAMAALRREGGGGVERRVRRRVVDLALAKGDRAALLEIRESPEFEPVLSWHLRRKLATEVRDYPGLFFAVFMENFSRAPNLLFVVLTLIGASAWFAILVGFIGFSGRKWWGFLLPVAAGVLSVVPTLFILILQEDINGLEEQGEFPNDIIYWIGGVGLREEVSKLLLFGCFLPFLLKLGSPAHALIAAACVGLGFAAEENIGYYMRYGVSTVGFGRYVTSTCIHMFLTGIAGYGLYWMCVSPKRHYEQFLIAFIFAVVIHGLYDLLQSDAYRKLAAESGGMLFDEGLAQWIVIGITAACAYRFFGLVDASRLPGRRLISPLGLFVVGGATVWGAAMMAACIYLPFHAAFSASGTSGLSVAIIAFIYINRFRDE